MYNLINQDNILNKEFEENIEVYDNSNNLYENIFNDIDEAIIICDINTAKIINVNAACEKLLNYSKFELLQMPICELIKGIEQSSDYKYFELEKKNITVLKSRNNIYIPVEIKSKIIETKNKKYYRYYIKNISEKKNMEDNMDNIINQFEFIINHFEESIYIIDLNNKVKFANKNFYKLMGKRNENIIGEDINNILYQSTNKIICKIFGVDNDKKDKSIIIEKDELENPLDMPIKVTRTNIRKNDDKIICILIKIQDLTMQRQKEQELIKNKERYELAINGTDAGVWDRDIITKEIYFSPRWKEILGYKDHEIKNDSKEWLSRIHPEDFGKVYKTMSSHLFGEREFYSTEYRMLHKDGTYRWIQAKGKAVRNKEGKLIRFSGSHQEITEKKLAEEKLIKLNSILKALNFSSKALLQFEDSTGLMNEICYLLVEQGGFELVWIGTAVNDKKKSVSIKASNGKLEYLNKFNVRWSNTKLGNGPTGTAIKTRKKVIINDIENDERFSPWKKSAVQNGLYSVIAIPLYFNKKSIGCLAAYSSKINVFQKEEIFLLEKLCNELIYKLNLIEAQKEKEKIYKELQEKQIQLQSILNNSPALISIKDIKGNILLTNKNFGLLDGPRPEEYIGKNIYDLFPQQIADELWKNDLKVIKTKKPIEAEEQVYHKDKSLHTYLTIKFPVYADKKTPYGICAISTDITERINNDKKLKNSLLEQEILLQEVHHRVKNNLQIISSLLELQGIYTNNENLKNMIENSQNRIKTMSIAHEILYKTKDFSNINFKNYIKLLIKSIYKIHGISENKIKLKLNIENKYIILNKAIYLGIIINELITNSLKHAFTNQKRGEIGVILKNSKNKKIELVIYDTGSGIKTKLLNNRRKTLGLHLVHLLARNQLKGEIISNRTNGTLFKIIFTEDIN
ncbi:MAG: PAS domain S-box protein [Spirochaetia bacterium]|nr:PAS domain S-box protein [Spirochaetia bacterium]